MRASKIKSRVRGNLKGLKAKAFYDFERISKVNLVAASGRFLPENLWKKFDRGKPLNNKQGNLVVDALNAAALKLTPDYPFTVLLVIANRKITPECSRYHYVYKLTKISVVSLESVTASEGTVYLGSRVVKKHGDREGRVGFSSHAIKRFIERVPRIMELAKRDTGVALRALSKTIQKWEISDGDGGFQLKAGPFGSFTMVWDHKIGMWVCTTFLEKEFKGTAENIQKKMEAGINDLLEKYN